MKSFSKNPKRQTKNPAIKLLLAAVCFASLAACQSAANLSAADKADLSRINQIIVSGQSLTPPEFQSLKQIRERYPNSTEVRNLYQSALIMRGDWESIVQLINSIPAAERTRADHLNLAQSYLNLARYREAIALLKPLTDANPKDLDYNSLLAQAHFNLGETDEAARRLDAVWDAIVQNKRTSEINTRGMIYFRGKNFGKAIEIFQKTLEINADDISANNALSRVYAAHGDTAQAEAFRIKTEKAQQLLGEKEAKGSQMVQRAYALEEAWKAKRYEEVISLVRQMLPDASAKNKPALYQYLIESYKALGKTDEARKALAEAQNLK